MRLIRNVLLITDHGHGPLTVAMNRDQWTVTTVSDHDQLLDVHVYVSIKCEHVVLCSAATL